MPVSCHMSFGGQLNICQHPLEARCLEQSLFSAKQGIVLALQFGGAAHGEGSPNSRSAICLLPASSRETVPRPGPPKCHLSAHVDTLLSLTECLQSIMQDNHFSFLCRIYNIADLFPFFSPKIKSKPGQQSKDNKALVYLTVFYLFANPRE